MLWGRESGSGQLVPEEIDRGSLHSKHDFLCCYTRMRTLFRYNVSFRSKVASSYRNHQEKSEMKPAKFIIPFFIQVTSPGALFLSNSPEVPNSLNKQI